MTDAELLDRMNVRMPPTSALLGMTILAIDSAAGTVRMSFTPKPDFCNPAGNIQGGFVVAMLDDAAALAAIITSGASIYVPTIELKTSFFAPARGGEPVFAEGRCLKLGKRIAFMEADLTDAAGTLLARLSTSAVPLPMPDNARLVARNPESA